MNKERVFRLVYDLLDEYDIEEWENIQYIDLANFWVEMINETSKKSNDFIELEKIREDLLYEYLFPNETRTNKLEDIRNYIKQSDLDKMLWGKELMKILDREDK